MSNYRPVSMDDDSSNSNSSSTNELADESMPLLRQIPCEYLSHHDRIRLLLSYLPPSPVVIKLVLKLGMLTTYFSQLLKDTRGLLLALKAWVYANPKQAKICIGVILLALACASPAILGAIGFSAAGPVAGSIAAGWQAGIGSVAAGSLFAFLQSAAMGGAAIGLFSGIGAVGALIVIVQIGAVENVVREKVAYIGAIIGENSVKAGEAIKDGAIQIGGAVAVGAIQMGKRVGGWWEKMKEKMKGE